MANAAMRILMNPKARTEVRGWAVWALGMMRYQPADEPNFNLLAYGVGQFCVDMGESMVTEDPKKISLQLGVLVDQVLPAFAGTPGVPDSGILVAARSSAAIKPLADMEKTIKEIGLAANTLFQSPKSKVEANRKALKNRVDALKDVVSKIEVKNWKFTPAGPEFKSEPEESVQPQARAGD